MSDFILFSVLACCAICDVRYHRIPNCAVCCGIVMGLACIFGGAPGPWEGASVMDDSLAAGRAAAGFMGRMALVCGLGFPFFVLRMTGAGDIKVMGLIAAFLGLRNGGAAIAAGLCLGAVLALGKMLYQGSMYQRFSYLSAYIRRVVQYRQMEKYYCPKRDGYECVIPLGACFFVGSLFAVMWKG